MKKIYFFLMAVMVAFAANAWTVKFTNPDGWTEPHIWAWNGGDNLSGAKWPGDAMTKDGDVWVYTGTSEKLPASVIFNDNGGGAQTSGFKFTEGATYDNNGEVGAAPIAPDAYNVYLAGNFNSFNGADATYKFTYSAATGAYTLHLDSFKADSNFKVVVDGNWLDYTNGPVESGAEYVLSDTGLNNSVLTGAATDVNFSYVVASKKLTVTYKTGDEPVVPPVVGGDYPASMLLIGDATGWLDGNEVTMTTVSDGVYTYTIDLAKGANFRFMSAENAGWDSTDQWGGAEGDYTNVDAVIGSNTLVKGKGNFLAPEAGKFTVKVDLVNMTMTLTKDGDEPIVPPVTDELPAKVYLVGAVTDWAVNDAYLFTKNGNVYTLECEMPEGAWKIWNGTWDWSFGSQAEVANGVDTDAWFNAGEGADYTTAAAIVGKIGLITLTVTDGSAVEGSAIPAVLNVTVDTSAVAEVEVAEGEAVYFNLQGQKVANPENGIYVKVVNGKATKVVVK